MRKRERGRRRAEPSCSSMLTTSLIAELAAEAGDDDEGDCKFVSPPVVSGNKWSADKLCKNGRRVRASFSAESPDQVKGTIVSGGDSKPR
jgi:hypothetical protein